MFSCADVFAWKQLLDRHVQPHVKALELRIRLCFKLTGIRGIRPNLIDDHVKLRRDQVVRSHGRNRTERSSAGSISLPGLFWGN
jgi:hypothetical protein